MRYINILTGTLISLALISCDRTRSTTGWDYMPDMYYSNAYESYTANPNFSNDMTMRVPAEGSIPRGMIPFKWKKTIEDQIAAGEALINPLEPTSENLAGGKAAYEVFCIDCHGPLGDGKGYLFTSRRYPVPPKSLISDEVKALKEGEIYHTITVGFGVMGAHGAMISPEERWQIILHIRESLQK
jgi:mono/diheme cytochrome c family protein